ncbi:mechanosensitive ion channel domain-containing protein [Stieleria varia]|nr:mechanosensitive ion channel domain-containing protein [Stieleria varia]
MFLVSAGWTRGQDVNGQTSSSGNNDISIESVEKNLAELSSDSNLDESSVKQLEGILQRAKQSLGEAEKLDAQASQYNQMVEDVAQELMRVDSAILKMQETPTDVNADASVDQISQRLTAAKSELSQAVAKSAELSGEPTRRNKRLTEIPQEITQAETALAEIQEQLSAPLPTNETDWQSQARLTLLKAQSRELNARIESLRQEQAAYMATTDLLPKQQMLASQRADRLRSEIDRLQTALTSKRWLQAEDEAQKLQETLQSVPAALHELAKSNLVIAKSQQQIIQDSETANNRLTEIQQSFDKVKSDLTTASERVTAVGLTDALGMMLREQRDSYETLRAKYRPRVDLSEKVDDYRIAAYRLEDEAETIDKQLASAEPLAIDWRTQDLDWSTLSQQQAELVLLHRRRELIGQTLQSQSSLVQTMLTTDTLRRELLQAIDRFTDFVDRNLFWTRSAPAFSVSELQQMPKAAEWFLSPSNWQSVSASTIGTVQSRPLKSILLIVLGIAIMLSRPRMRRVVLAEGKNASRFDSGYRETGITLLATATSAAFWPIGFGLTGYLLLSNPVGNDFARGLGAAATVVAIYVASRELLKEACRDGGLAEIHFGWIDTLRRYLRRHIRWYTLLGGIGIFLMVALHSHPNPEVRTFGGRVSATFLFLVTAIFHHVLFRNSSPLYHQIAKSSPDSILIRRRRTIWWLSTLLPVSFALMSMAGYLDTTYRLGRSLQSTFLLLVICIIALGLVSRWLTLHRRDVMIQRAKEKRKRRAEQAEQQEKAGVAELGIELDEDMQSDLPTLDQQTRQTVSAIAAICVVLGLAFIWSDVLPALRYFDDITLWQVGTGESIETVSLLDIAYAILATGAIFLASRNLPSMLELLVLSRTTLDSGARYAISSLLSYVVLVVGALVIMNLLSVPYQQLGWLLAAISVGLGFGLQEIVANFVSGIILLLERPVRVGDVVTIDSTTGVVSRIQMRATTVTSWDRKELVVPNKDLITQKLLNWSLSNVINRLTLEIGVEYGADPDHVREILRDVVTSHPEIMDDPPPLINLETFGDNALIFHVRFYLATLEARIEVTHQVNARIAKALSKAGISIPFPQRDVHLRVEDGAKLLQPRNTEE